MNKDIQKILDSNKVKVELKQYKELPTSDGFHMRGNLYVNNKKAFFMEDIGVGGGLEILILNKDYAKPLLDLKDKFNKVKAYPENKSMDNIKYSIEHMFYEMAEDFLLAKELKKHSKKHTMVKFENESYKKGEYVSYSWPFDGKMINFLLTEMVEQGMDTIEIWNVNSKWDHFTKEELRDLL